MKKEDILQLFKGVNACRNLGGEKFSYFIARNNNALKKHVDQINQEVEVLIESFGVPNNKGVKELKLPSKEYKDLMAEELDVNLFMINLADLPKEILAGQMTDIYPIINPPV